MAPPWSNRTVAAAFGVLVAVLGLVVWLSSAHLSPAREGAGHRVHLEHLDGTLGPWLWWDAAYYDRIARDGYTEADAEVFDDGGETSAAFFPAVPVLARLAGTPIGDPTAGLLLVSLLGGLVAAIVLHRWAAERVGPESAVWTVALVFLFPWAYALVGTGYSESVCLAAAVGAFLLVERDRPVAAGLVAAVATATRSVGIGVVIGLALRTAERRGALEVEGWRVRWVRGRLRRSDAGVLLGLLGIGSWMAFSLWRYGDPIAFSTAQRGWNQGIGRRSLLKLGLWEQLQHNADRAFVGRLLLQAAAILLACTVVPAVWRRLGVGYAAYTVVVLALPLLGSANFASNGRFVLMAFPVFAILGERLRARPWPASLVPVVASAALLLVFSSYWSRGFWMA